MTDIPDLQLNDGYTIPQLGFGVAQVPPEQTARITLQAFEAGYRHLDTAPRYGNEKGVGEAIRDCGLPRDHMFVTSKLPDADHEPAKARASFERTLKNLGLEQLDLFLIHWPLPMLYGGDFESTWETLIEFQQEGRARSIGVSNFQPDHLARLASETGTVPAVNQIEVHPYFTNETVRAANQAAGILTEAWSPIARGGILRDNVIIEIAEQLSRTTAQVILRWHIQRGDIITPKSSLPERMAENLALFDFELDEGAMRAISGLDKGEHGRTGPHPDTYDGTSETWSRSE